MFFSRKSAKATASKPAQVVVSVKLAGGTMATRMSMTTVEEMVEIALDMASVDGAVTRASLASVIIDLYSPSAETAFGMMDDSIHRVRFSQLCAARAGLFA